MGRRGPRPAPIPLRVLKGERKDRLPANPPKPSTALQVPKPPRGMDPQARRIWRRLAPELHQRAGFTHWDLEAFEVFCEAVVERRNARALLADGLVVEGYRGGQVKNPAWQVYRDASMIIRAFAQEFGLTPSARSGIDLPEMPDDEAEAILTPKRVMSRAPSSS